MLDVHNILVARDFSGAAQAATRWALDLATRTGATLHTLYADVLRGDPFEPSAEPATPAEKIRERLKQAVEEDAPASYYDPESVRLVHAVRRDIAAAPAILRYADERNIDLVVMGTHGRRGVRRLALGSVAEEVVREAPCPVLTVGGGPAGEEQAASDGQDDDAPPPQPERILAPTDFSEHSRAALRHAKALAALLGGATVDLFHVIEEALHPAFYGPAVQSIYDAQPDIEQKVTAHLEEFYRTTEGPGGNVSFAARPGRAPQALAEHAASTGADLIVMATHGRTGLKRFLIGSVAEKVVRTAPCPVFAVKSFGKRLVDPPPPEENNDANAPDVFVRPAAARASE